MNVLIVDDDEIQLFMLQRLVQLIDLQVNIFTFTVADEALKFLKQAKSDFIPDVLFLDINMPEMDGWTFLSEYDNLLPTLQHKIPIYIITSSVNPTDAGRALGNPLVRGYITKPITQDTMKRVLEEEPQYILENNSELWGIAGAK